MGGIWIVAHREGVTLYRNGIMQDYPLPSSTKPFVVVAIVADRADPLLIPTSEGLFRWNSERWESLNETNGLPCNRLLEAIKDGHDSLGLRANCGQRFTKLLMRSCGGLAR